MPSRKRFWSWLALSALIIVLDQLTKLWVSSTMSMGQSIRVTPFFDLVLVHNPGAAFSFLSNASGWQRWFFSALAAVISIWLVRMLRRHAGERLMPLALSLILAGALGNLIDRLTVGAVIDFLYFHAGAYGWPAFNVADSAISVGVAFLLWDQFMGQRAPAGETR